MCILELVINQLFYNANNDNFAFKLAYVQIIMVKVVIISSNYFQNRQEAANVHLYLSTCPFPGWQQRFISLLAPFRTRLEGVNIYHIYSNAYEVLDIYHSVNIIINVRKHLIAEIRMRFICMETLKVPTYIIQILQH